MANNDDVFDGFGQGNQRTSDQICQADSPQYTEVNQPYGGFVEFMGAFDNGQYTIPAFHGSLTEECIAWPQSSDQVLPYSTNFPCDPFTYHATLFPLATAESTQTNCHIDHTQNWVGSPWLPFGQLQGDSAIPGPRRTPNLIAQDLPNDAKNTPHLPIQDQEKSASPAVCYHDHDHYDSTQPNQLPTPDASPISYHGIAHSPVRAARDGAAAIPQHIAEEVNDLPTAEPNTRPRKSLEPSEKRRTSTSSTSTRSTQTISTSHQSAGLSSRTPSTQVEAQSKPKKERERQWIHFQGDEQRPLPVLHPKKARVGPAGLDLANHTEGQEPKQQHGEWQEGRGGQQEGLVLDPGNSPSGGSDDQPSKRGAITSRSTTWPPSTAMLDPSPSTPLSNMTSLPTLTGSEQSKGPVLSPAPAPAPPESPANHLPSPYSGRKYLTSSQSRILNRAAVKKCRLRTRAQTVEYKHLSEILEEENERLRGEYMALKEERVQLKLHVLRHSRCEGEIGEYFMQMAAKILKDAKEKDLLDGDILPPLSPPIMSPGLSMNETFGSEVSFLKEDTTSPTT